MLFLHLSLASIFSFLLSSSRFLTPSTTSTFLNSPLCLVSILFVLPISFAFLGATSFSYQSMAYVLILTNIITCTLSSTSHLLGVLDPTNSNISNEMISDSCHSISDHHHLYTYYIYLCSLASLFCFLLYYCGFDHLIKLSYLMRPNLF